MLAKIRDIYITGKTRVENESVERLKREISAKRSIEKRPIGKSRGYHLAARSCYCSIGIGIRCAGNDIDILHIQAIKQTKDITRAVKVVVH